MTEVKQKVNVEGSRRTCTYEYYLQFKDGKTAQVCKEMFCGTIGIPSRTISDWINPGARNKEKTTKSEPTLRLPPQVIEHLQNWLKELPTVPSHYCRKTDTYKNKKFLYPGTTIACLYKCYCTSANEVKIKPVSPCTFNTTFHESNYSIFIPRKDQCDLCISAKHGNITKDQHLQHIHAKELAHAEKNRDKSETDIGTSVWTMDLQCVLMCPKSNASAMYYKQKLQIHNFTLFNIKTKAGYCYVWTELNGNMSSEMFAYLQFQHFENILSSNRSIQNLIIWSDGCGYQNRNVTIANIYIHLSRKFNVTVTQKYLVSGHTQMECDNMHSTIERKLICDIFTPREYIVIMQSARLKPAPYYVKEVVHSEVKQLSGHYLTTIRPGKKVGDPTVHELRAIQFNGTGAVHFKLNFDLGAEWQELPHRIVAPDQQLTWLPLFENPLPIKTRKFIDLQAIKRVLPSEVHDYYDTLPHV